MHTLLDLRPQVLAPGHGDPLIGPHVAQQLAEFGARLRTRASETGSENSHGVPTVPYRRIAAARAGGPEVLGVVQRQLRSPRAGEIRIRVEASSVTKDDVQQRQGRANTRQAFPFVPGAAVVGEVDAVGQSITDVAVGQRVVVLTQTGGYSDYVFANRHPMMPLPFDVDAAEAVVVAVSYLAAHHMLSRAAHIQRGQKILITGAADGVGTALVQLGQLLDLTIYGVASAAKLPWLQAQGVVPLDGHPETAVAKLHQLEPEGMDVVLDGLGGPWGAHGRSVLGDTGMLVEYADAESPGRRARLMTRTRDRGTSRGSRVVRYTTTPRRVHRRHILQAWTTLFRLLAAREIEPVIADRLPLTQAAQAHTRLEDGSDVGSLVLIP